MDAAQMAVAELNAEGGVLGRPVEAIVRDGASSPERYAAEAESLIADEAVCAIFGCWSSASRKAVKPIIEARCSILFYPMQYEGLEQSPHIVYTGSCLNQQIEPGVDWALSGRRRRCLIVGSDCVYPRTANMFVRAAIEVGGGEVLGEHYVPLTGADFTDVVAAVVRTRPDIVFSTVAGEANRRLFHELARAGVRSETCPVLSFSVSELELRDMLTEAAGHYACRSYFDSLATTENRRFKRQLRHVYGDAAIASDPMVAAYVQVHLWAGIVERCGSLDAHTVLRHAAGQRFRGPSGCVEILENNHVAKHAVIGRATQAGTFEIVWKSPKPLVPKPWLGAENTKGGDNYVILRALEQYTEAMYLNWKFREEIQRRKLAEDGLRQARDGAEAAGRALRRREQVAEGLGDILRLLNSDRPLRGLLRAIVDQARRLAGSQTGAVYRLDEQSNHLRLEASAGMRGTAKHDLGVPANTDPIGRAVICRQAVAASGGDLVLRANDEGRRGPRRGVDHGPSHDHGAMLVVPLVVRGRVWGVLSLTYGQPRAFGAEDLSLVETIGDHAALAIENERLRDMAEESAAAAERAHLARDLHDAVTQSLFTASLLAEALSRQLPGLSREAQATLADLQRLTRGALAEMRMLILGRRPVVLGQTWLGDSLRGLAEAAESRMQRPVSVTVDGHRDLPSDVQIALYHITQEALNNTVRHSGARQVAVRLHRSSRAVRLRVEDDGRGFDEQRVAPQHLGLGIMRERAESIGARLVIEGRRGGGTVVKVDWHDRQRIAA